MLLTSKEFLDELEYHGVDFFCGVPDLIVGKLVDLVEERGLAYMPATCEDVAVGVGVGAYLAGKKPCVFMQNSGFGNASDAFVTLAKLYRIPMVFVISVPDMPVSAGKEEITNYAQHLDWKRLILPNLDALEMPYTLVEKETYKEEMKKAMEMCEETKHPVALIIRKGYMD